MMASLRFRVPSTRATIIAAVTVALIGLLNVAQRPRDSLSYTIRYGDIFFTKDCPAAPDPAAVVAAEATAAAASAAAADAATAASEASEAAPSRGPVNFDEFLPSAAAASSAAPSSWDAVGRRVQPTEVQPPTPAAKRPSADDLVGPASQPAPATKPPWLCGLALPYRWLLSICVLVVAARLAVPPNRASP
jgi:hypothetical protein